jgi:hypothetical protein
MITIVPSDPESGDARLLIDELSATLASIAGDGGPSPFPAGDARGPRCAGMTEEMMVFLRRAGEPA